MGAGIIYCRVDVDFRHGLRRGVPYLLELFRQHDVRATFYVVMGPDTLYRHSQRVSDARFRRRLRAVPIWKLIRDVGPAYVRSRWFGGDVAAGSPERLDEIVRDGHRLGIHGFDHADWADRCYEMSAADTRDAMVAAWAAWARLRREPAETWGAPNWRTNAHMFELLDAWGIRYTSNTRGVVPFHPILADGRAANVLELPITLPCLNELVQQGCPRAEIPALMERCLSTGYNMLCIHDYYEGILERTLFADVLAHLRARGWRFRSLDEACARHTSSAGPAAVARVLVPGGAREVCCQDQFLERNYFERLPGGAEYLARETREAAPPS